MRPSRNEAVRCALETVWLRVLSLEPTHCRTFMHRAALRAQLGRDADALEDLNAALELRPNSAAILLERAFALKRLRRTQEARSAFEAVLRM